MANAPILIYKVPLSNYVGHQQETVYKLAKLRLPKAVASSVQQHDERHPEDISYFKPTHYVPWSNLQDSTQSMVLYVGHTVISCALQPRLWQLQLEPIPFCIPGRPQLHQYRPLRSQCSQIPEPVSQQAQHLKWSIHFWINRKSSFW